jgi:hypothetical protein
MAMLLVGALMLVATAGKWFLSSRWYTVAALILAIGVIMIMVRAAAEYRREHASTAREPSFGPGWRVPLVVAVLSSAAAVLTARLWTWQPRVDFDVLGVLWLLQNVPGVALVTFFAAIALAALAVLISSGGRSP